MSCCSEFYRLSPAPVKTLLSHPTLSCWLIVSLFWWKIVVVDIHSNICRDDLSDVYGQSHREYQDTEHELGSIISGYLMQNGMPR